jgi:hypothetical protein
VEPVTWTVYGEFENYGYIELGVADDAAGTIHNVDLIFENPP